MVIAAPTILFHREPPLVMIAFAINLLLLEVVVVGLHLEIEVDVLDEILSRHCFKI